MKRARVFINFLYTTELKVYRLLWYKSYDFFDNKIIWYKSQSKSVAMI